VPQPRWSKTLTRWLTPWRRLSEEEQRFLFRSLGLAVGVRAGILLVAYCTGIFIIGHENTPIKDIFLEVLNRWDAPWYLQIAEYGYRTEEPARNFIVFFPLYPLAIRLVHFAIPDYFLSAVFVSFIASVVAGYFLQALIRLDRDEAEADRGLWYFFLFPTAHFLVIPYTEGLFLALVLGSFLAARRRRWTWAGALGMLACATRIQGLALVPALAVEAIWQERWRTPLRAFWLLLTPIGFVAYLLINWHVLGDPLEFMTIQREFWQHDTILPWEYLIDDVEHILQEPSSPGRTLIFDGHLVSFAFAAVLLGLSVRWLRPSYQVYAWAGMIMMLSVTFQISMPRYLLAVFPLFIVLARFGRWPAIHQAVLPASALFMGCLYIVYATRFGF